MKFTRDLTAFAQTLGIVVLPAERVAGGADLPNSAVPVLSLAQPLRGLDAKPFAERQKTSFLTNTGLVWPQNQVAGDAIIAALGPGLWELNYQIAAIADFTPAVASNGGWMYAVDADDATKACNLHGHFYAANVPVEVHGKIFALVLPKKEGFDLRYSFPATGAGQNLAWRVTLQALRHL